MDPSDVAEAISELNEEDEPREKGKGKKVLASVAILSYSRMILKLALASGLSTILMAFFSRYRSNN